MPVEDRIRRAPTLIIVNEAGEEIGSGKGNSHSLWVLSRRLVRMLLKQKGPIALTAAAAVLVGPGGVSDPSKHRSQTQVLGGKPGAAGAQGWLARGVAGRLAAGLGVPMASSVQLLLPRLTCGTTGRQIWGAATERAALPEPASALLLSLVACLPHRSSDHGGAPAVRHWLHPLLGGPAGAHLHEEEVGLLCRHAASVFAAGGEQRPAGRA